MAQGMSGGELQEYRQAIQAVLPIIERRKQLMLDLREALLQGNDAAALLLARRLCGLPVLEVG